MSASSSVSSSSVPSSKQRSHHRSSAWRKGSSGRNRRASVEGSMHTTGSSVSTYPSLPTKIDRNRRSSTGTTHPPIGSSSTSAESDNPSETSSHLHDELKDQLNENLYLTHEILDLKMRLANAMAQIDAEKHTNRLQAEQISHLCDDNDELTNFLSQAYTRIAELAKGNGNGSSQNDADQNLHGSALSTWRKEGWLQKVASAISMTNSNSASSSSDKYNLCADTHPQRKETASPSSTASTQQSPMTLAERSTRRLSLLSLGSSLAEEELHVSFKERMYCSRRRSSMCSSLSTFREEDMVKNGNAKASEDDWLDGGIALPDDIEQSTFAARNA